MYLNNVVSTTPKFSNGKKNNSIIVSVPQPDGNGGLKNVDFEFFYEETTETNGLEVVVPVKKHEKKEFFRAIEEQLMYIPNIVFQTKGQNDFSYKTIDISAKVLYKDENIVISESTVFDFPHILLGTGKGLINYGRVDFEALELEKKRGAVGLILDINAVEVTPSREAVVWSAKTRAAVIDTYNKIVETATKLINKELNNTFDYLEWMWKAGSIKNALVTNQAATGSVLQKLSGIVDASTINKIFYSHNGMNTIYTSDINSMMGEKLLIRSFTYDKYKKKVTRDKIKSVNSMAGFPVYVTDGASDKYRDRYLFEQVHHGPFIVIKLLEGWNLIKTSNLVGNSSFAKKYDEVIVPEAIMDTYLAEEANGTTFDDDESASVVVDSNRLAKLRKLEQKILFHSPYNNGSGYDIVYSKEEVKISEIINNYSDKSIVYGSFDNRDIINAVVRNFPMHVFSIIRDNRLNWQINEVEIKNLYYKILKDKGVDSVTSMLISKENEKHIADLPNFKRVNNFIVDSYKDGKLVINPNIRFALTFIKTAEILDHYAIPGINKNLFDSKDYQGFYKKDFAIVLIMREIFHTCISKTIHPFFAACINYELNKGVEDDFDLKSRLATIDNLIPEELCDTIDEIEDVHIVDAEFIHQVETHAKFFHKYMPILREVQNQSDTSILEVLQPLIDKYEGFPEEIKHF